MYIWQRMPYVAEDTQCLLYSNVIASTHTNSCSSS